jgi:hypothetical protein
VELHPIVAALVEALNTLNEHKTPRTKALKDATTVSRQSIFKQGQSWRSDFQDASLLK